MALRKEVFNKNFTTSGIATESIEVFDAQEIAEKSDYLPHNKLRIVNRSSLILYIFLDEYIPGNAPDYVLGADKVLDESLDEGVNFNTVIIYNSDNTTAVSAGEVFVRVATAKEF